MSQTSRAITYVGTVVDTPQVGVLRIRFKQAVVVASKGFIVSISPYDPSSPSSSTQITHLPPFSFLLPTFTDLHVHPPQYLYYGTGLDLPLMQWLPRYAFRAEQRIDASPDLAEKVYGALTERWRKEGTGAVLAFGTIKVESNLILAKACLKTGIRGYIGKLSMDQASPETYIESSPSASLKSLTEYITSLRDIISSLPPQDRIVHPVVTPRFVPTCSDELLSGLGKIAKGEKVGDVGVGDGKRVMVQSHMCESWDEMEWVRGTRGKEDEDVFEEHGLLTDNTIQAHVTSLPPKLMKRLVDKGTAVAHCPLSNVYFSDAVFPLREALDMSLRVGLGSDIAGGYAPSILTQMRQAVNTSRFRESRAQEDARALAAASPPSKDSEAAKKEQKSLRVEWKESLWVATRGGAEALGLDGRFEVGAAFDAQLIQVIDPSTNAGIGQLDFFDIPNEASMSEEDLKEWYVQAIERWWCNGDDRNRVGMWVQGRDLWAQ